MRVEVEITFICRLCQIRWRVTRFASTFLNMDTPFVAVCPGCEEDGEEGS